MDNSLNFSFEEINKNLQNQFYVNVPFPIGPSVIKESIQAFFEFLELPESVKTHINFSIAPTHRRGNVGYQHRDPNEHIYNDSKDFFHYHPDIFKQCESFLRENPIVYNFLLKAKPIWDLTEQAIKDILALFESQFPSISEKVFNTESVHILLRFLKYDWQSSGKYLAKPHYDAGSLTLAIAESCPGLRIGSHPENLKLVEHKPGNAIFMLGSNFKKLMASDQLSAGWHDVIQLDENFIGKPFARWAIVAFIEAHGVEALPRTETHKWAEQTIL